MIDAARPLDRLDARNTLPPVSNPSINLNAYQAVLLDLDGTVYHEEHALPGAVELIKRLQRGGRPYACLTNSTSSPARLTERLRRMGVDVDPAHIYTAAAATCDYVLQRFGDPAAAAVISDAPAATTPPLNRSTAPPLPTPPRVFNLSTEGVHEMLDGKVRWVQGPSEPCDAVICGVPLNVFATEERQRTAMLLLRRGAALVAICADRVYPSPRGLEFGVGAFAAMFAYAADVTPVFCGKPEALFFQELCRRLGVRPEHCVLVGDNLESDIAGAAGVGMQTILTLTGVATRADAEHLDPPRRPGWIIEDLRDLLP
jgi:HAD superfamily hydrolase (TIGR01450 family)